MPRPRKRLPAWTWADVPDLKRRPKSPKFQDLGEFPAADKRPPPDPMMVDLCHRLTQADIVKLLAEKTVSHSTLTKWRCHETRTPRIDTLRRVARELNLDISLRSMLHVVKTEDEVIKTDEEGDE